MRVYCVCRRLNASEHTCTWYAIMPTRSTDVGTKLSPLNKNLKFDVKQGRAMQCITLIYRFRLINENHNQNSDYDSFLRIKACREARTCLFPCIWTRVDAWPMRVEISRIAHCEKAFTTSKFFFQGKSNIWNMKLFPPFTFPIENWHNFWRTEAYHRVIQFL